MAHDIFISYSTKDQQTADAICHVLEENGLRCWIAPRNITSGMPYAEEILYGLKNAKIIVLVFSKNSQESEFVKNEIDTAFNYNKSIISFKIDETMPEDEMEFFLKNKHWLEAYPEPEKVFETLVRDASRLCNESQQQQVIVSQKSTNKTQKFGIRKEKDILSIVFSLIPGLTGVSFLYMGLIARVKEWMLMGVLCFIPVVVWLCYVYDFHTSRQASIAVNAIFIIWAVGAIACIFVLRNEFLSRKTALNLMSDKDEHFDTVVEEFLKM